MGLSILFQPLESLLGYFQAERHKLSAEKNQQKDQALADINAALLATTGYLSQHKSDRRGEDDLSARWARAAASSRHFDPLLAERLQLKAFYWGDRASIKDGDVIKLKEIRQATLHLIRID